MVGIYAPRTASVTVTFTGAGLSRGSPTFGWVFSLVQAQPQFEAQRKAATVGTMFRCFDGVGFPAG